MRILLFYAGDFRFKSKSCYESLAMLDFAVFFQISTKKDIEYGYRENELIA